MSKVTACPLDCYDACGIVYEKGKLKGLKIGHTKGFLCPHLNHFQKNKFIQKPRYMGKEIELDEALNHLYKMLKSSQNDTSLFYKGSGNLSLMQNVTGHFFASFGTTLTEGSLCDGAGEAGIEQGRGSNLNMSISQVAKSDVVIFWGRNPHVTSSHLLPQIKDKKIIVIDPVKTKIAKQADLHVQIKPHMDLAFALLLNLFVYKNNLCDIEYLNKYAKEYKEFYELIKDIDVEKTLEFADVSIGQIMQILALIKDKKVAIVCGVGIQKYIDGADVIRAIDSLAVMLGLFGKEGCGVAYLGYSSDKIVSPFVKTDKKTSIANTKFNEFKTVFIQGANPLSQMPDTKRVEACIKKVQNLVYFGLYENETSKLAHLVIPAKSFLYKDDVRTSYSHNAMMFMPKILDTNTGISEYDLSGFLCKKFYIDIQSEEFYINHFKSHSYEKSKGIFEVKGREEVPYKDGFDTKSKSFNFLKKIKLDYNKDNRFFLLTSKSLTSLNSQFKVDKFAYVHSSVGFKEAQEVIISSQNGSVVLPIKHNDDLRKDCVLIYSGTNGVNNLTSSKHSEYGKNAVYQQDKVKITNIGKNDEY